MDDSETRKHLKLKHPATDDARIDLSASSNTSSETSELDTLESIAQRLLDGVIEAIHGSGELQSVLETCRHPAYVKTADGQMLQTNSSYNHVFGNGMMVTGRYSKSFLDETIVPLATYSDEMILSGCTVVRFDHPGRDSQGQAYLFHSVKKSLLALGHPKMAILGLCELVKVDESNRNRNILSLSRRWNLFKQLDERDRQCAALLAMGEKTKSIADRFGVSDKTIDNRRAAILKTLGLKNPMELTRLLCRLQDNGFCDFGL